MDLPLIAPRPARLSRMIAQLEAVEASGTFSNNGPVVQQFEQEMTERLFGGRGACLAVANATLGLMLALRHALHGRDPARSLVIMPSFTFAATAQAALWCGATPLLADCDPDDWALDTAAIGRLIERYGRRIGAIVPYATFGNSIDLDHYAWLARRHDLAVVVDAAASLGSQDAEGRAFGTDAPFPVVFSMHATKTFATSEGGVVYCRDAATIAALRSMANFGFDGARSATLPGLNAKLAEVPALLALAKLDEIDAVSAHRETLAARYRERLGRFTLQRPAGHRQAMQFFPVLLPPTLAPHRDAIVARLAERGIGAGAYFSPHLAEQPHFRETCLIDDLPVTHYIAARAVVLPVTDAMTIADVDRVAQTFGQVCDAMPRPIRAAAAVPADRELAAVIIGGGPAGTALLCAAAKAGRLEQMGALGTTIVDRGDRVGAGLLGRYGITSDSSAETFLTADAALPPGLSLAGEPEEQAIRAHIGGLGVPLPKVGAYLDRLGSVLSERLCALGGAVLTGHEVVSARHGADGLWHVRARERADGSSVELSARSIVVATGGYQPAIRLVEEKVAGHTLVERCGSRLIQSDTLLREEGVEALRHLLGDRGRPLRIAIVGGSTSAISCAARLLQAQPSLALDAGSITVLHRRPLRPFYPSAEAARADGYDDFTADDICPVSGFVYRLAGFRLEARELVIHSLGINGRRGDPRLRLHRMADDDAALRILDDADCVVAAFGYRPNALPLLDEGGRAIRLRSDGPTHGAMVDDRCRLVDTAGAPVPGAFGIGLAAGYVPSGQLGGERSFRGQANGLWLWQNDVGRIIVDQLLARATDEAGLGGARAAGVAQ